MKNTITRRRFLQHSAAAAVAGIALPTLIPASAFGANDKIALGCIGVGGMGTGNMKNFLGVNDCRVVAVCDAYQDRQASAKALVDEKYGNQDCRKYGDYRELLARKDIDAVMIAVQDHWHALIATAAAAAGKDMYLEKPTGLTIAQSQAIRQAVRQHKRVFQAGTWQRSQGSFRQACELARNGYVGKIHTVQVSSPCPEYQPKYEGTMEAQPVPEGFDWNMWRGPAPTQPYNPGRVAWPDWYLIWDYCAGFICNWGVHHLDIACWGCPAIAAESFEVECKGVYRKKGFTDNIESWQGAFQFASGLKMNYIDAGKDKPGTKFIGDKGWVYVDRAGIWSNPEDLLETKLKDSDLRLYKSANHFTDFLQCMRSRRDPVSNIDATHIATSLGLIADIAARLETKLKWDSKQEKFIGNDAANERLSRPMHNGWKL